MKYAHLLILTAALFLISCGPKTENQEQAQPVAAEHMDESTEQELPATDPLLVADSTFRKQIASVFTAYVDVKDALVDSDAGKVNAKLPALKAALTAVQPALLSGDAAQEWKTLSGTLTSSVAALEKATELNQQREALPALSENVYKCVKAFGLNGTEAWYAYCPMALNNKGAYWLSNKPEIRNPYFGASMLNCGGNREHLR